MNPTSSDIESQLKAELESLRRSGLYRQLHQMDGMQGPRMKMDGREVLLFAGSNYLGLAGDPRLRMAASAAIADYGCAAGGARLINGNLPLHEALERRLAEFLKCESALLFSTGYMANLGVITALAGPDDIVFSDALNHASIVDAIRLSRAETCIFPHNDVESLERFAATKSGHRRRILVVDGVFSMEGDVADLANLATVARRYDMMLMVDDAHGIGVLGQTGRGVIELAGLQPDIVIGNLGKALGSFGAFVACSHTVREYLINRCRPFIFTCGIAPALAAAALAALEIIAVEGHRRDAVLALATELRAGLRDGGFNTGASSTHIIPAIVGDNAETMRLSEAALKQGVFAQGIRFPSVPRGTARLRFTPMFGHRVEDVQRTVRLFRELR